MGDSTQKTESLLAQLASASVYDLEQPRRMHAPTFPAHWPGHIFAMHRHHEPSLGPRTSASGLVVMTEHSGTHIDALCHQAENMTMYGGVEANAEVQTSTGFTQLGAETIEPIIRRGVIIDLPLLKGSELPEGHAISARELQAACDNQALSITPGTIVLVRTGYGSLWDEPSRYLKAPGVEREGSEWLADLEVFGVGIDNVAWDLPEATDPVTESTLPGHLVLLVRSGIYIIENLYLEKLAETRPSEFVFACLPLKFQGGTGCPVRPLALIP
jgi:kynurenine formamidase